MTETTTSQGEARDASRRPRLRRPRPLTACVLVGIVMALAWAIVLPPFQGPDEQAHVAYVQHLAETGDPPHGASDQPAWSSEEQAVLTATLFDRVVYNAYARPIWLTPQQRDLDAVLARGHRRDDGGGYSNASGNPPLYYALEAVPYKLASSGTLLDRLLLMRLLSVLLGAVTVAASFLFLRELFRRPAWAPVVGALAVAFQPTFGFISGTVNNDNLIVAAAAVAFWLVAASFRRGLTNGRAIGLGLACAAGVLAKLSMLGLLPGAAFGMLVLLWRADAGEDRRAALRALAAGAAAFLVPVVIAWVLSSAVWDRSLFGGATAVSNQTGSGPDGGIRGLLSYTWQFYLPALPGMHQWLGGYPFWDGYWIGWIGRFGWQDTTFPGWVYRVALIPGLVIAATALVALVRDRVTVRRRWLELASYALMMAGLLAVIAAAGFSFVRNEGMRFEQGRYLLALLPLYGAVVALAARGFGRRFAPVAAGVIVVVLAFQSVAALLLAVGRYYL